MATGMRIGALACVGHVLVFDEETPERLLEHVGPDVLLKGGTTAAVIGSQILAAYGSTVRILDAAADVSTTRLAHSRAP
jgi:bifunctional ADP-heptose synthase (sugar kinase/adenylyltransferase)